MTQAYAAVGVPVALTQSPLFPAAALMPTLGSHGRAVTVTAHATPHSKGAWTEVIASTSADTTHLLVGSYNMAVANNDTRGLIDIGVGAAASEVAIISALPAGFSTTGGEAYGLQVLVPVRVRAGTRVAVRLQALVTVDTAIVNVYCLSLPPSGRRPASSVVTMGADTATSTAATFMTVSATYAEIIAATTQPFAGLIALSCGGASAGWSLDSSEVLTLAIGASGSEVTLAVSAPMQWSNGENLTPLGPQPVAGAYVSRHIPAGTRIACKVTTGRAYKGVIVLGVPY